MNFCQNCGAEFLPGDTFCSGCGEPTMPPTALTPAVCRGCGYGLPPTALICPRCGTPASGSPTQRIENVGPQPLVPQAQAGLTWATTPQRKTKWSLIIGGSVGGLVIVGLVLALILTIGGSTSTTATATKKHHRHHAAAQPTTTTTIDPVSLARSTQPELYDSMMRIGAILEQSASGRGQVGQVVAQVQSCTIDPNQAAIQIDSVVANRTTVLNQLSGIPNATSADTASVVSSLQSAIGASIEADRGYSDWMKYLYNDYYYTYPIGCPSGRAPTNYSYDNATSASARATQAKTNFIAVYNPIASRFGLRTWSEGDI